MKRYAITGKAGQMVAGHNNRGVGTILDLEDDEAKLAVERGELVDLEDLKAAEEAAKDEAKKGKKDA